MEQKYKIWLWSLVGIIGVVLLILLLLPQTQFPETSYPIKDITEKIPLKIGYKGTSHYLSVMVAKEKGFFAEEGLDAEIIEFQNTNHIVDGVLAGQLDVGRGALVKQFQIELKQPGTLKTFMVNKQTKENYIDDILVRKDSSISSLAQLKGKTIGTNEGSVESSFLEVILKKAGLNEGDYTIITMKPDLLPSALEAGSIDAFFSYEPITTVALTKGIAKVLSAAPIENFVIDPLVSGGHFMRADYIAKNPETAKKIARAFSKAAEFMVKNPKESEEILAKYTVLKEGETSTKLHIITEHKVSESWVKKAVQEHADVLVTEKVLEKQLDVSSMLVVLG